MNLELKDQQVKDLAEILYVSNYIGERVDEKKYRKLRDYIYSEIYKNGYDDIIKYDNKHNIYYETDEIANYAENLMDDYNYVVIDDYKRFTGEDYDENEEEEFEDYEDEEYEEGEGDEQNFEYEKAIVLLSLMLTHRDFREKFGYDFSETNSNAEEKNYFQRLLNFYFDEFKENGVENVKITNLDL